MSIPDSKESALTEECRASNLHAAIMNLPCKFEAAWQTPAPSDWVEGYVNGHRDTRHAAAELALRSDAINAELLEALTAIRDLKPRAFNGIPADWNEQIAACDECQRYKGHPIQNGICDTHRQPIWARERHNKHEEAALGYRAMEIAREALNKATQS